LLQQLKPLIKTPDRNPIETSGLSVFSKGFSYLPRLALIRLDWVPASACPRPFLWQV